MRDYFFVLRSCPGISDKLWCLCGIAPCGKSSISLIQEFFAGVNKILILGAARGPRL